MLVGGAAASWAQRASAQQQKAAAGNPAPRLDWLARHKEPILEPGLPIIDPHHHLWQRPGWRYLLDDLLTDTGSGHNIVATVYMEASSMYRDRGPEEMRPVGEVEFANGVAAMCGVLGLGSYRSKQEEVFSRWASSIKALAARPNVFVKLGGLGQSYTALRFDGDAEPPSSEKVAARFRPYVETCITAFGASRCMFESNFPVDKISYSYPVFWNACKLMAKGASSSEKVDLFAGSAARCYRLNGLV